MSRCPECGVPEDDGHTTWCSLDAEAPIAAPAVQRLCSLCKFPLGGERTPTLAMMWMAVDVRNVSREAPVTGLVTTDVCWYCVKAIRLALEDERKTSPTHARFRDSL